LITGQVLSVVFDGTHPLLVNLTPVRGAAFPLLIQLTDTAGRVIDLSTTSGTATWSAALGIAQDYGDGGPLILAVYSATSTTGGSQITFSNAAAGEVLVYVSPTDTEALPSCVAQPLAYCVFSFVLTDPDGVSYPTVRGVLYPQEHVLGAPS
jgi:hypothetical protein